MFQESSVEDAVRGGACVTDVPCTVNPYSCHNCCLQYSRRWGLGALGSRLRSGMHLDAWGVRGTAEKKMTIFCLSFTSKRQELTSRVSDGAPDGRCAAADSREDTAHAVRSQ